MSATQGASTPTSTANDSTNGVFALKDLVDITMIQGLHDALKNVLRDDGKITIDAGEVQRIDTAGLQLLATFVRQAQGQGVNVEWRNVSSAFGEAARLLGLEAVLLVEKRPA